MTSHRVSVTESTVSAGTSDMVRQTVTDRLAHLGQDSPTYEMLSNPDYFTIGHGAQGAAL